MTQFEGIYNMAGDTGRLIGGFKTRNPQLTTRNAT